MESVHEVPWVVERGALYGPATYTIGLLGSLVSRCWVSVDWMGASLGPEAQVWYSREPVPDGFTGLRIRPDPAFWDAVVGGRDTAPRGIVEWGETSFPVWSTDCDSGDRPERGAICPVDPVAAAFFLVSRLEEWRSTARDRHGRFPAQDAWMVKHGLIERPLVHEYAAAVAAAIGGGQQVGTLQCAWPGGSSCAVAMTHDIDRVRMHGPLWQDVRRALGALRFPGGIQSARNRFRSRRLVRSGVRPDPYQNIEWMAERHEARGHRSTFFLIQSQPSVKNADYRCEDPPIAQSVRSLAGRGFEIGLHGSYFSFENPSLLPREKAEMEGILGQAVRSTRQHYLRFRPGATWRIQVESGIGIDSSLGFAERIGFRAGLAVPFRPWDFRSGRPFDIWELPLIMMDVTVREYMRLTTEEAVESSRRLLDRIAAVGGVATVLWHNSSFDEVDWPGWPAVYEDWLEYPHRLGAWFATVSSVVDAWQSHLLGLGVKT